jgi:F-type H+-transporting ATPase subunit a
MIYFSHINFSALAVGKHWYLKVLGYQVHGQVLVVSLIVFLLIAVFSVSRTKGLSETPREEQNLAEYITEFIQDISITQIGQPDYLRWTPFVGAIFIFILVSNWLGALVPWRILVIPEGELAAPTNDINTTAAIALLTSAAYFYRGISKKGVRYFGRYIAPAAFLLPINILEDFTKPISISFRLFGNILADELVVGVLITLVPFLIPIPLILLGLFTSAIQALVFATLAGAYIGESVDEHHLLLSIEFQISASIVIVIPIKNGIWILLGI